MGFSFQKNPKYRIQKGLFAIFKIVSVKNAWLNHTIPFNKSGNVLEIFDKTFCSCLFMVNESYLQNFIFVHKSVYTYYNKSLAYH